MIIKKLSIRWNFVASKLFKKIRFLFICVRVLLLPSDLSTKKQYKHKNTHRKRKIIIKTIKVGLDISLLILGIDYAVNKYKHKIGSSYINPGPILFGSKFIIFRSRELETNSYRQIVGGCYLLFIFLFFLFFSCLLTIR